MCQDLDPILILIYLNFLGFFCCLFVFCFLGFFVNLTEVKFMDYNLSPLVGKFCNVITPLCTKIDLAITVYSGFSCVFTIKINLSIYWVSRPCFNNMFLMFVRIKRTSLIIISLSLLTCDFRLPILAFSSLKANEKNAHFQVSCDWFIMLIC